MKTAHSKFLAFSLVALMVFFNVPFVSFAASVTPVPYEGNDNAVSWSGNMMKLDPAPKNGEYKDLIASIGDEDILGEEGELIVTISGTEENDDKEIVTFSWSSNIPVKMVSVKGGNGYNLYTYPDDTQSDTGLIAPDNKGISHITFFYEDPIITGNLRVTKRLTSEYDVEIPDGTFWFQLKVNEGINYGLPFSIETVDGIGYKEFEVPYEFYSVVELDNKGHEMPSGFVEIEADDTLKEGNVDEVDLLLTVVNQYTPSDEPLGTLRVTKRLTTEYDVDIPDGTFWFQIKYNEGMNYDLPFSIETVGGIGFKEFEVPYEYYAVVELDNEGHEMPNGFEEVAAEDVVKEGTVDEDDLLLMVVNHYTPNTPDLETIQLQINKQVVDAADNPLSRPGVDFEVTLTSEPYESREAPTNWAGAYPITTALGKSFSYSYDGWPYGLIMQYNLKETIIPTNYSFLRFEVQFEYDSESDDTFETFTTNDLDLNLWGESQKEEIPNRILVTVVNLYTPPQQDDDDDDDDERPQREPEEDEPVVEVEEEIIVVDTPVTPLAVPEVETTVVPVVEVPLATLPQTGEVPSALFYGLGSLISGIGVFMKRKH